MDSAHAVNYKIEAYGAEGGKDTSNFALTGPTGNTGNFYVAGNGTQSSYIWLLKIYTITTTEVYILQLLVLAQFIYTRMLVQNMVLIMRMFMLMVAKNGPVRAVVVLDGPATAYPQEEM